MSGSRSVWMGAAMVVLALASPGRAEAQDVETIPGVSLGLVYSGSYFPALAIQPFTGSFGGAGLAPQVEAIIGRDLRNSDRFEVMDSIPPGLVGDRIDYSLWDRLGAVWLVTGSLEGAGDGFVLVLELHDVVYGEIREQGRYRVPAPTDPDFRMAVHRASDGLVQWATGDPGQAASRIVFTMTDSEGNSDAYSIDSDGENLVRLTDYHNLMASPSWSPDGSKIVYTSWKTDYPRIYELDLETGLERMLPPLRGAGDYQAPVYAPDGRTIAFSVLGSDYRSGIFTYNWEQNCCLAYLSGGPWYDMSPTYSPDGQWLAFFTMRFGDGVPQVMMMPAEGGPTETLSPYEYASGGFFADPDWSPYGDRIAFHGRIERGRYHILVMDMADNGRVLRQLTNEGNNEHPSWAPDGRHLVFTGERSWGYGLFVVDASTGRTRALLSGRLVDTPDWSLSLPAR